MSDEIKCNDSVAWAMICERDAKIADLRQESNRYKKALEEIKKRCLEATTIMPINDLRIIRGITKEALNG